MFKALIKIEDVTEDTLSSYGENPKSQFLRTSSMNSVAQTGKKDNKNFNTVAYLPGLFENAVYVDNKKNKKSKKADQ